MKQYFDVVVQPGLTFAYSPQEGYSGLLTTRAIVPLLRDAARRSARSDGRRCLSTARQPATQIRIALQDSASPGTTNF